MSRQRLDVSHARLDAREVAKAGRRQSAAELLAARERRQQIEKDQAARVSAALRTPSRPISPTGGAGTSSGERVSTSQQQVPPAAGVRGGGGASGAATSPATASVSSRPPLRIPPGATVWKPLPAGSWVLSGEEKAAVERLLAAQKETEE